MVEGSSPRARVAFEGPREVVRELTRLDREGLLDRAQVAMKPGDRLEPVPIRGDAVTVLTAQAARRALGASEKSRRTTEVIWSDGGDELAVDPGGVTTATTTGAVVLTIPVRCDQTGPATVDITFVVGSADHPGGLHAATPERPRGPAVIVDRWADPLVAFAWSALLELARSVTAAMGRDARGDRLIAGEFVATDEGLQIVPYARHRLGRLQS
jgi:hypothetical protein